LLKEPFNALFGHKKYSELGQHSAGEDSKDLEPLITKGIEVAWASCRHPKGQKTGQQAEEVEP
jgi:hypothetical protein